MFGWWENREVGKLGGKRCFQLFGWGRKIVETKNRGESFLPRAHFFNPPKSGGKCGEKSVVEALLHKYPSPTPHSWLDDLTFASSQSLSLLPLLILTFTTHQHPRSLLSLSLFFFFFFFFSKMTRSTFHCFLRPGLLWHWDFFFLHSFIYHVLCTCPLEKPKLFYF